MRTHASVRQFVPVALVIAALIAAAVYIATGWPEEPVRPKAPDPALSLSDDEFDRRFFSDTVAEIEQYGRKAREVREREDAMARAGPLTPEQKAAAGIAADLPTLIAKHDLIEADARMAVLDAEMGQHVPA